MLKPETERIWAHIKDSHALAGFVLIGGTALTLHIAHRLSEDLDFAYTGEDGRLPHQRINALVRTATSHGFEIKRLDDPAALEEFETAGMDLHQWEQTFLVNGLVKLTFFVPEPAILKLIHRNQTTGVRVASLAELFKTKALVSASRSKSRDWFDLFILMKSHGFTLEDYFNAFRECGLLIQADTGLARLCSGKAQLSDEGYQQLIAPAPSLDDMADFFRAKRDEYEISEAARRARQSQL